MEFNKETPTGEFKVQGEMLTIIKPFAEGHVCTAAEAGVLNQVLAENTRNNWADRVKKALEEGNFDKGAMQAEIDEYLESYDFGVRRGRGPSDPVEREALNMAKDLIRGALRKKGFKIADISTDEINRLADEALVKNPEIAKEAKRRVDNRRNLTSVADDIDLEGIAA